MAQITEQAPNFGIGLGTSGVLFAWFANFLHYGQPVLRVAGTQD